MLATIQQAKAEEAKAKAEEVKSQVCLAKMEREKRKREPKEKEKEHVFSSSTEPPNKRARFGVTVTNPITGRRITIGDLSHEHNRVMFNFIKKVREEVQQGIKSEAYTALVDMIAEAYSKGLRAPFYDPLVLPEGVLQSAKEKLKAEMGEERFNEEVNTDAETETNETYHGDFIHQTITSDKWPEKSFPEDLAFIRPFVERALQSALEAHKRIRFFLTYRCLMAKTRMNLVRGTATGTDHLEEVTDSRVANIKSGHMQQLNLPSDISEAVDAAFFALEAELDKYTENGSGFRWIKSVSMDLSFSRFITGLGRNRQTASIEFMGINKISGGSWVRLPKWLQNRQVFNPKINTTDQRCFVWAILRGLYPPPPGDNNTKRCADLKDKFHQIILPENIRFPVAYSAHLMRKVEELNDFSLSVFLLGKKVYEVMPIYITHKKKEKHVQLGIIEDAGTQHYVTIKDLSRIAAPSKQRKRHFCENCLSPHNTPEALVKHEEECFAHEPTRIKMPVKGAKGHLIKFGEWRYKLPAPFVVYADFEALLKPAKENASPNVFSCHKPIAWAYYIKCQYEQHRGTWSERTASGRSAKLLRT